MGCSNQQKSTMITEASTPSELQQRNIDTKQYSEEQIKIYSEMLVNENKEDVMKCYEPLELIGQGSFGKVFKVKQISTGNIYAMKVVSKIWHFQDGNKNFLREISILKKLDHPNVLKIYEYFSNDKYYYFIMEYVGGGDQL